MSRASEVRAALDKAGDDWLFREDSSQAFPDFWEENKDRYLTPRKPRPSGLRPAPMYVAQSKAAAELLQWCRIDPQFYPKVMRAAEKAIGVPITINQRLAAAVKKHAEKTV